MTEKWYKTGLAFSCKGCGNCCSGPDEGYIWVNQKELPALAALFQTTIADFTKKYTSKVGRRHTIIEKQPSKDCIFLKKNNDGSKSCEIYLLRPIQCRTWPFWKENIRTRESWLEIAKNCPGINQGQWYDKQAIEAISNGNFNAKPTAKNVSEAAIQWIIGNLDNADCLIAVQKVYRTIDNSIAGANPICDNCGNCCDFDRFGHRLYVTTLEMLYFFKALTTNKANAQLLKKEFHGKCPFRLRQGCIMRDYRPSGCRIFFCRDLPTEFQNEITEHSLFSLKILHEQFSSVYYYTDLLNWLKLLARQV